MPQAQFTGVKFATKIKFLQELLRLGPAVIQNVQKTGVKDERNCFCRLKFFNITILIAKVEFQTFLRLFKFFKSFQ